MKKIPMSRECRRLINAYQGRQTSDGSKKATVYPGKKTQLLYSCVDHTDEKLTIAGGLPALTSERGEQ
jgi:hypothetical protein